MGHIEPLLTVVELPEYERRASKLFNDTERRAVIEYLSTRPKAGVVMQGINGIRKLRWVAGGRGKSRDARVVYYFHNRSKPLFMLTLFGKNEKANLSMSERKNLSKLTKHLINSYGETNV